MVSSPGDEVKPGSGATGDGGWVVCALGSNLGDRRAHLDIARRRLPEEGFGWVLASPVVETPPVGGPMGQGPYLNQVLAARAGHVSVGPEALLESFLRIEAAAGRVRRVRWGPRTLDIDLLFYGDRVIDGPGLTVPHPRVGERRFVLEPLVEILPDLRHPVSGRTMRELLAAL